MSTTTSPRTIDADQLRAALQSDREHLLRLRNRVSRTQAGAHAYWLIAHGVDRAIECLDSMAEEAE